MIYSIFIYTVLDIVDENGEKVFQSQLLFIHSRNVVLWHMIISDDALRPSSAFSNSVKMFEKDRVATPTPQNIPSLLPSPPHSQSAYQFAACGCFFILPFFSICMANNY